MLTNIETRVKDMSVRREYETPEAPCKLKEAPCKLKLFISRANLDISEMCLIDVHCKAFWKGNSFFLEIIWSLLTKNSDNAWQIHQMCYLEQ